MIPALFEILFCLYSLKAEEPPSVAEEPLEVGPIVIHGG